MPKLANARWLPGKRDSPPARLRLITPVYSEAEAARAAALVKKLGEIEQTLRLKDYENAETRLKDLLKDYSREPRIFFALAQTASLAAADATDEEVQAERLNRALGNYRLAVEAASPETDRALISRAHEAMGRIYAFLENTAKRQRSLTKQSGLVTCPAAPTTRRWKARRNCANRKRQGNGETGKGRSKR